MRAESDAQLMSLVTRGDRDAFARIVDRHKHALVNYLTGLTRDRDHAEELAQEAFLRLFHARQRYREQGQFLSYLFRIATNLRRTEERKARRRQWLASVFQMDVNVNGNGHAPSPQSELLREEATAQVAQALERLPLAFRSALLLREMEGWSYKDIAAALDCEEGTVKSRIHRGREALRQELEAYWNGGQACRD